MHILSILCALTAVACFVCPGAEAAVDIQVDLTTQTMHVSDGGRNFDWPVSTARIGYATPRGVYHPVSLQTMHYSHKYDMSPMPHSIFFKGGYAIHGTYETASLGRPASHGCVRLSPAHAALLFKMVQSDGARIEIAGAPPASTAVAAPVATTTASIRTMRRAARITSVSDQPTVVYIPSEGATYYYGSQGGYYQGPRYEASPW